MEQTAQDAICKQKQTRQAVALMNCADAAQLRYMQPPTPQFHLSAPETGQCLLVTTGLSHITSTRETPGPSHAVFCIGGAVAAVAAEYVPSALAAVAPVLHNARLQILSCLCASILDTRAISLCCFKVPAQGIHRL